MAAPDVYRSPVLHRLRGGSGSSVDIRSPSPRTLRKTRDYDEYRNIAHYCIYRKLETHPRQDGSPATPPMQPTSPSTRRVAKIIQRVAAEVEKRYCSQYNDMCCKLRLTSNTTYATFASVANEIFSSGVNWGRVAALFAFASSLAWSLTDRGLFDFVERVADWVAQFLDKNLGEWIASKGGWNAFVKEFERKCPRDLADYNERADTGIGVAVLALAAGLVGLAVTTLWTN